VFVWSDRLVEAEENGSQIGFRAVAGVLLELRLDVDDEGGADRREQTGLRTCSVQYRDEGRTGTYENQGGVQILIVLLHVFGIVLHRLPLVHGIEIDLRVIVLDGLEVHPEGLLDAVYLK